MADQRSIEMLTFNFASRTFAYRHLAQGLGRVLSPFSSFMREYLDKIIKADRCAQYVDEIGIAANDADHLIANLRATFQCIQEAVLKLTMHKCHFGAREIDFLGRTITPQGVKPQRHIAFKTFLKKPNFRSQKRPYKDVWDSWTTTKTTSQDFLNALRHSTSCWRLMK